MRGRAGTQYISDRLESIRFPWPRLGAHQSIASLGHPTPPRTPAAVPECPQPRPGGGGAAVAADAAVVRGGVARAAGGGVKGAEGVGEEADWGQRWATREPIESKFLTGELPPLPPLPRPVHRHRAPALVEAGGGEHRAAGGVVEGDLPAELVRDPGEGPPVRRPLPGEVADHRRRPQPRPAAREPPQALRARDLRGRLAGQVLPPQLRPFPRARPGKGSRPEKGSPAKARILEVQ
eukprot:gene3719-biopygen9566